MVSINNTATNSFVLASLRQTNSELAASQTRIGTGYKVNNASDNPSVWATAQSLRSDIKAQDALNSSISLAKAKFDASISGIDEIMKVIGQVKDIMTTASAGTGSATITDTTVSKLKSLGTQITSIIAGAGVDGSNYLNSTTAVSVKVGSASGAAISVTPQDLTAAGSLKSLTDALAGVSTSTTNTNVAAFGAAAAETQLTTYQGLISAFSGALGSQQDFLDKLKDIKTSALSALVDTDMEEESAKISALQVRQQLAFQALAITNSSAQNILTLFR